MNAQLLWTTAKVLVLLLLGWFVVSFITLIVQGTISAVRQRRNRNVLEKKEAMCRNLQSRISRVGTAALSIYQKAAEERRQVTIEEEAESDRLMEQVRGLGDELDRLNTVN